MFKQKKAIILIFFFLFSFSFVIAGDLETYFGCGGDLETSFLCQGDIENSIGVIDITLEIKKVIPSGGNIQELEEEKNYMPYIVGGVILIVGLLFLLFWIFREKDEEKK